MRCPNCTDGNAAPVDDEGRWIRCGSCGGTGQLPEVDPVVSDYLKTLAPKARTCCFCGAEYVGLRVICSAASCEQAWALRMEERKHHNPYGPIDSGARKTFLITELPEELKK